MDPDIVTDTASQKTLHLHGLECAVHSWNTGSDPIPKGIVVLYHGFLAHGRYPTVRYAAELMSQKSNNYAVVAVDFPGHGASPGLRGYLPSPEWLIEAGVVIAKYADRMYDGKVPLFLVGSSMGGSIALSVSQRMLDDATTPSSLAGVVLLAPMLAIDVAEPLRYLLKGLSFLLPTVHLITSTATDSTKQYRDLAKRLECDQDELTIKGGKLRVASASTCVELASNMRTQFEKIETPFLCMIGNEDTVVDNKGALELMERAASADKTLKKYDALHGLLCEPSPLVEVIQEGMMVWINERAELWVKKD